MLRFQKWWTRLTSAELLIFSWLIVLWDILHISKLLYLKRPLKKSFSPQQRPTSWYASESRYFVGRMLISLHVLIELWYITNPEKKKVKYVGRWAQDWTIINNKCLKKKKHVIGACKDSKPQSWTSHWQNQTKRHLGSPLPTTQVQTRPKIIFSNW